MNHKKCIIFGAGRIGKAAYNFLKDEYEIIGFADNDSKKWGKFFCEKLIYSPDQLGSFNDAEIIVATIYYRKICEQLERRGINHIRVFFRTGLGDKYILYQWSDMPPLLFYDCKLDRKKVSEIEKDFTRNYSAPHQSGKAVFDTRGKKNVLFCAYAFPPLGGSGVQRSLKFVKYLRKFGYEPIVLTVGKNDGTLIEDSSMLAEVEDDINVVRIDYDVVLPELVAKEEQQEIFNLYMGVMQSENWIKEYRQFLQESPLSLLPDNMIIWVNRCLREIEQKVDLKDIDIIYTTGNPFSTFFLGYYIKKKYGIKWVMDYRDPWMSNDYYVEIYCQFAEGIIKLQQQLENKLVSLSDCIIGAADFEKDMIEKYGIAAAKFVEITNGYDEDDFKNIKLKETKNAKFTLCYNGRLHGERSPLYLQKIINHLIEETKINSCKIQWIWNGCVEERWKHLLDEEDKYGLIQYNGYLSHKDSITSAMNADLLIHFGFEGAGTDFGYCGKLFEYLRMKKPILSFSTKGGVLDKVFQETHSGKNFDYRDEPGIAEYLLEMYDAWEQGTEAIHPNEEEIKKYDRENLTFKLASVFNEVLNS